MAELTQAEPTSSCCAPEAQQTCCEPSEKAACCETSAAGGTCGCVELRETVRARYAAAAVAATGPDPSGCCDALFGQSMYADGERDELPDTALIASLGCGNPTAMADLHPGESVLDLGSGGGIDVLLSARRVGPTGKAYGLDMTDEMLVLAERNRRQAALDNVELL